MGNKKIIGLNTAFGSLKYNNFDERSFASSVSLLDYDAVVIDLGYLSQAYSIEKKFENKDLLTEYASHQIKEDFPVIKDQLVELLKQGRTVFLLMGKNEDCFIYTGERQYSGTGKNARQTNIVQPFDMYSFLPIKIHAVHVYGSEFDICCKSPYREFLKQTIANSQYASYFSIKDQHTSLAKIAGTDKMVSAVIPYEQGKIVCLPQPYYKEDYTKVEYWKTNGKLYLDQLFELCQKLSVADGDVILPDWTNEIYVLNEADALEKQKRIENRIAELELELTKQKQCIEEIQKYKLLLTASGGQLEEITKHVLSQLDFKIFDAERGRSDIVAQYDDVCVVAEIKGVSKSAAEKHAAQLEKWVAQYIEDNEIIPKALLIVNGFCDIPVFDRNEEVFPHQMLKYCEARGHALITTTQLLCLYIEIQQNPECKAERIHELLSCVGKYPRYQNFSEFLIVKENGE